MCHSDITQFALETISMICDVAKGSTLIQLSYEFYGHKLMHV